MSSTQPELFYGGGRTASCSALMTYAKSHGQFVTDYQPGDLVFLRFSGQSSPEHIGLVECLDGTSLVTIEGNTGALSDANGGQVQKRIRSRSLALGAYRPDYEEEDEMDQATFNRMANAWLESRADLGPANDSQEGRDAREWAERKNILMGDLQGRKQYQSLCTREQALMFLYRAVEKD